MFFNFAIEYAIKKVQANQQGLKLNGTPGLLVYADDVNIFDRNIQSMRKSTKAFLIASKEIGLKVNAKEIKCMDMSRDRNAEQNSNIKTGKKFFERLEQFNYLGTILTHQTFVHEEVMSRLSRGIVAIIRCRIFSFTLLSKNVKFKIYRT